MLDILQEDFRRCMALCGCKTVSDINRSCLARINADGVLAKL
jgi:(S)-2-hydroxy-acid oxidase